MNDAPQAIFAAALFGAHAFLCHHPATSKCTVTAKTIPMTISLIQSTFLLLAGAHLFGRIAQRFGQPELLGHMLAGIVLGAAALNWVQSTPGINALSDFAVLFVVMTAGLEMRLRRVAEVFTPRGLLTLLPGFLIPVITSMALARWFNYDWQGAWVVAACVAVTALPVALRILSSFGLLSTRIAQLSIAGALFADIVVLLTLGVLSAIKHEGTHSLTMLIGMSLLKVLGLLVLVAASAWVSKLFYKRNAWRQTKAATAHLPFALLLILLLAAASEWLGLHFAIGTFFGALIVNEYHGNAEDTDSLRIHLEGMSTYVFAPLFLACQGLHFTIDTFTQPLFTLALLCVAVGSKLVGGYLSAHWYGLTRRESQGVAIIMNARGVMEMVIAAIAYRAGLVDAGLFSILLVIGVATTVFTPLMLQYWQKRASASLPDAAPREL